MKKLIGLSLAAVISVSALTGCTSIFGGKANGLILYGTENQIQSQITKYKNDITENHSYEVKVLDINNQKTLVMSHTIAKNLQKQGLLRTVKGEETTALKDLPDVTKEKPLLFAKTEMKDIKIDNKPIAADYKGNIIIGNGRTLADSFLVVEDAYYETIKSPEIVMGVLHFDKDPKNETVDVSKNVEKFQMVTIEEEK